MPPVDAVIEADLLPAGEYSPRPESAYVVRRKAQMLALTDLVGDRLSPRQIEDLLRVSGNQAYFVATVYLDMVDAGKDIASPAAYLRAAISNRIAKGRVPQLPVGVVVAQEEVTPEFLARQAQAQEEGQRYWGDDNE